MVLLRLSHTTIRTRVRLRSCLARCTYTHLQLTTKLRRLKGFQSMSPGQRLQPSNHRPCYRNRTKLEYDAVDASATIVNGATAATTAPTSRLVPRWVTLCLPLSEYELHDSLTLIFLLMQIDYTLHRAIRASVTTRTRWGFRARRGVVALFQFVPEMNTSCARRNAACSGSGFWWSSTDLLLGSGPTSSDVMRRPCTCPLYTDLYKILV